MDHFGAAIGPILASLFLLLWPGQLRWLFLTTLIPGIAVVGLLAFGLRDVKTASRKEEPFQLNLAPFAKNFRMYLVALVVYTLGNASDAFLLVRAGELGVPTVMLPLLWCAFHVVKSAGNLWAGPLVDRFGPRPMITVGWVLYAAVYVAFAVASAAWQMWALFLAYALFYALTEPAEKTLVTKLVAADQRGLAFGWYNFAIGIAALPSSVLFGWLYQQYGPLVAFGWGAGLALTAAALLTAVRE